MVALVAAVSVSAQTYVAPKFTDNTYVSLRYGVTNLMHPQCNGFTNWAHSLAQQTELQFGKYVTPRFAVAIDGTMSWDTFSHEKMSQNTVPFVTVAALAKYRVLDFNKLGIVAVAGPGWVHGFDANSTKDHYDSNGMFAKFQLEFAYKVTDRLAIDVVPELNYNFTTGAFYHQHQPTFDSRNAWYGLNVGVTYRLGDKFKECPYTYTQGDVDHLNATINDLRAELAKKPTEVVKTVVEKSVVVEDVANSYTVYFDKNSSEVASLASVASALKKSDSVITVIGSTSPEGSETLNKNLAVARAEAVKSALVDAGISADRIKVATDYSNQRRATIVVE